MTTRIKLQSPELEAVVLALRIAGKDLRKDLYARARSTILPDWQSSIEDKVGGNKLAYQILAKTARVNIGTRGIRLTSATSSKALKGGLRPSENFAAVEFGAKWRDAKVAGRRGSTRYNYNRQINTSFKHRKRKGYYVFPAADQIIKRVAALWVQTTVRTLRDAVEGKS
jgi:hypothetical protein